MKWLIAILSAFFKALLPWLARQARPTAESADPDRHTRDRLLDKVRKHWGKQLILFLILALAGCVRTVYVPHGTPVRLRETVRDAKIWVKADGEVIEGRMDLPEGWYVLPVDWEDLP